MKKVEKEYRKFKKEIERKQEIIMMLESIKILGEYLPNEEVKSEHFYNSRYFKDYFSFIIDIAHTNFYKLFYKMLPKLIENNFKITLGKVNIDGLDDWLEIANIDSEKRNQLKIDYYNMRSSFEILEYDNQNKRIPSVNLLFWLVENNMNEVLANLLVSDKVTSEQKLSILDKSLCEDNKKFCNILSTLPSTYMMDEWNEKVRQESFDELLTKNLQQVATANKDYFSRVVIQNIKEKYADSISLNYADSVIRNLIKFNLVDINEITFKYDNTEVTTATATELVGRYDLARYLYNILENAKTNPLLRDQSDKVLLHLAIHKIPKYRDYLSIYNIINRKNYINTSEKTSYILDEIDQYNSVIRLNGNYTEEEIEVILNKLLKKTPKEEYKKLKQLLITRKKNIELLVQKRQELTTTLGKLNEYLLENEPAKKKIKEIEFKK